MRLASEVMGEDIQYVFINNLFPHRHLKPPFPAIFSVLFPLTCNIGRFVSMSVCARMHTSRVYAFKFKSHLNILRKLEISKKIGL